MFRLFIYCSLIELFGFRRSHTALLCSYSVCIFTLCRSTTAHTKKFSMKFLQSCRCGYYQDRDFYLKLRKVQIVVVGHFHKALISKREGFPEWRKRSCLIVPKNSQDRLSVKHCYHLAQEDSRDITLIL